MRLLPQSIFGTYAGNDSGSWHVALLCAVLVPWMLVFTRAGTEMCVALVGMLFLWHSYSQRDWAWARTPFMRAALLAWAWLVLVVSPFAFHPDKSVLLALPWIRYALLVVALRYWLLRSPGAFKAVGISLLLLLAFCVVDTLWQYKTGLSLTHHEIRLNNRLSGPFYAPKVGVFMAKLVVPAVALGAVLAIVRGRRIGLAVGLGAIIVACVILLTGERTAYASSVVALLLMAGFAGWYYKAIRWWMMGLMALLIVLNGALFITQSSAQGTIERTVVHVDHFASSTYGTVLSTAWHAGLDYWPTGTGMQGFREITARIAANAPVGVQRPEAYLHAHNPYLEWFAEAGLVGVVLFAVLVGTLLREALLELRRAQGGLVIIPAAMLGAWVMNFFPVMSTQSYFSNWAGILTWYCIGLAFSLRNVSPNGLGQSDHA